MESVKVTRHTQLIDNKSPIVLLTGASGVGKTFLLSETIAPDIYFDLEDFDTFRKLSFQENFLELVIQDSFKKIAIDNLHLLPSLFKTIQKIIQKQSVQFFVSSPSLHLISKYIPEDIVPLVEIVSINSLSSREFKNSLTLDQVLRTGSLPAILNKEHKNTFLAELAGQVLFKTLYKNGKIKKPENFSKLMNELANNLDAEIKYEQVAQKCHVPGRTVREYVNLLVDFEIGYTVDSLKLTKQSSLQKKFYFYDIGFANALRNNFDLTSDRSVYVYLLEHFIFLELQFFKNQIYPGLEINFWKDYQNNSISFVLNQKTAVFVIPTEHIHDFHFKNITRLLKKSQLNEALIISFDSSVVPVKHSADFQIKHFSFEQFSNLLWAKKIL